MEKNKKTVIKYILISLLIVIIACCLFLVISIFCFTKNLAIICNDCGLNYFSSKLYAYEYSKSEDINYIYRACKIDVANNYFQNYIVHFNDFSNDENYAELINHINKTNYYNNDLPIIVRSSLINEDNYYNKYYIKSLINSNKVNEAIDYVKEATLKINLMEINYLIPQNYLLSQLLEYEDINYSVFDNEIIEGKKFSSYICEIYSTNMDYYRVIKNTENLDDIYFLNFCMTILQVGSDIKQIDENIDLVNDEFIVNLENNEIIVNQTINTILEKYDE